MADDLIDRIAALAEKRLDLRSGSIMQSTRGSPRVCWARHAVMWAVYQLKSPVSWTDLGSAFGRHRSIVRHAVERIDKERRNSSETRALTIFLTSH